MDTLTVTLGWFGIYAPVALGAIGSILGCTRAGQAACGAMLEIESGYGRYVGVSALPSSQTIYGIVVMFTLVGRGVGENGFGSRHRAGTVFDRSARWSGTAGKRRHAGPVLRFGNQREQEQAGSLRIVGGSRRNC